MEKSEQWLRARKRSCLCMRSIWGRYWKSVAVFLISTISRRTHSVWRHWRGINSNVKIAIWRVRRDFWWTRIYYQSRWKSLCGGCTQSSKAYFYGGSFHRRRLWNRFWMFRDSIFCTAGRFSCHHILAHSIGSYHIIPNVLCGRNCLSHKKDGAASFSGRALCGICWKSSDLSGGGAERVQLSDCLLQWKRQYPMAGGVQARVVGWCSLKNEKTHGQTWSPSVIRGCPLCRAAWYKCNQLLHILNS